LLSHTHFTCISEWHNHSCGKLMKAFTFEGLSLLDGLIAEEALTPCVILQAPQVGLQQHLANPAPHFTATYESSANCRSLAFIHQTDSRWRLLLTRWHHQQDQALLLLSLRVGTWLLHVNGGCCRVKKCSCYSTSPPCLVRLVFLNYMSPSFLYTVCCPG
jgi:hypothetical protein